MLDWIFKKNNAPAAGRPAPAAKAPAAAARPEQAKAPAPAAIDWQLRLQAAMGDDTALLALARESAPVGVKVAAISALASEASLKLAEREHRDHDRRVHRLAKQRHLALVARRETAESATRLIDAARGLVEEPVIPSNRLVALDRDWRALDATVVEAAQRTEFEALLAQLTTLTRERGDRMLRAERWAAEARAALVNLQTATTAAAAGTQDRSQLAAAGTVARAVFEAAPAGAAGTLQQSLRDALQHCAPLDERLAFLDDLLQGRVPSEPEVPARMPATEVSADALPSDAPAAAPASRPDPAARWQRLSPLADARLADVLNQRFTQWQQAREHARQTRRTEQRERARDRVQVARTEHAESLATVLERAEAALGAGHLAETHQHLVEIDELLHGGAQAGPQRTRIDALQAEYTRLKGWQHWGGGVARDDLVLQAEALAAATLGEPGAGIVKLSVRQQAEVIDDLRARWKELDRLGGATSRALWQRFDAALKTAYGPVAAHLDLQRAARTQNLAARDQLVEALNAHPFAGADEADAPPDWKSAAAALGHFQSEWRKLGPLEHTVPHKERDKLVARMNAAVQRLEAPLNEARRVAQAGRERLVARARALADEARAGTLGRDAVARVRDLQGEWQQHAAALPLTRPVENALWAAFKADIDAVFSARDAAFTARDAEFKAFGAERAALIERLAALTADAPATELRRTLAEVDAQWQRAGPAPRNDAAALDAQFRHARDTVRDWLATSAQRGWHATCDALRAKLALCEALEHAVDVGPARAALEQGWAAQPALPSAWEQALAERAGLARAAPRGGARTHAPAASADDVLLQLEAAYQLDSPAAFQAARRELKLHAMKAALEGRQPAASATLSADQWLAAALIRTGLDEPQRERLGHVIDALRACGPMNRG